MDSVLPNNVDADEFFLGTIHSKIRFANELDSKYYYLKLKFDKHLDLTHYSQNKKLNKQN